MKISRETEIVTQRPTFATRQLALLVLAAVAATVPLHQSLTVFSHYPPISLICAGSPGTLHLQAALGCTLCLCLCLVARPLHSLPISWPSSLAVRRCQPFCPQFHLFFCFPFRTVGQLSVSEGNDLCLGSACACDHGFNGYMDDVLLADMLIRGQRYSMLNDPLCIVLMLFYDVI